MREAYDVFFVLLSRALDSDVSAVFDDGLEFTCRLIMASNLSFDAPTSSSTLTFPLKIMNVGMAWIPYCVVTSCNMDTLKTGLMITVCLQDA